MNILDDINAKVKRKRQKLIDEGFEFYENIGSLVNSHVGRGGGA